MEIPLVNDVKCCFFSEKTWKTRESDFWSQSKTQGSYGGVATHGTFFEGSRKSVILSLCELIPTQKEGVLQKRNPLMGGDHPVTRFAHIAFYFPN